MECVAIKSHGPEVADIFVVFTGDRTSYEILKTVRVKSGEIVDVTKIMGKWAWICRNDGEDGWLPVEYLKRVLLYG